MRRRREEHDAAHRRRHERGKRAHERKLRDFAAPLRGEPIDDGDDDALWFDLAAHPERARRIEGSARWSVT